MSISKVKSFIRNNKEKIAIGSGIVIGGALLVIAQRTNGFSKAASFAATKNLIKDLNVPDGFLAGKITELWEEDGCVNAMARNLTANDLGKLGEEFVRNGLVSDGAEAAIVVEFLKKS